MRMMLWAQRFLEEYPADSRWRTWRLTQPTKLGFYHGNANRVLGTNITKRGPTGGPDVGWKAPLPILDPWMSALTWLPRRPAWRSQLSLGKGGLEQTLQTTYPHEKSITMTFCSILECILLSSSGKVSAGGLTHSAGYSAGSGGREPTA